MTPGSAPSTIRSDLGARTEIDRARFDDQRAAAAAPTPAPAQLKEDDRAPR